ncbi:MAG: zonular occludens toxin domain-containing protein [Nibricoccus sp.]
MSIHIGMGKPGGGKSYLALLEIIKELVEGYRNIVTNLPLDVGRLNEYLQQKYPGRNFRTVERVCLIRSDEVQSFWLVRGPKRLPVPKFSTLEKLDDVEAEKVMEGVEGCPQGVFYVIDEAQLKFNARKWAEIGPEALIYLAQHRKLSDRVWCITQAASNLDKQFRSVAEDFIISRNEYQARFGMFRGRGRFVARYYNEEPSRNSEPFIKRIYHLDTQGAASCYDTAKGIGVHGSQADKGKRASGIPIILVLPGAVLLCALTWFAPWIGGKLLGKQIQKSAPSSATASPTLGNGTDPTARPAVQMDSVTGLPSVQLAQLKPNNTPAASSALPSDIANRPLPQPVLVRGYLIRAGRVQVVLSDGRTVTDRDKELQRVDAAGTVVDGTRVYLERAKDPERVEMPVRTEMSRIEAIDKPRDEGSWSVVDGVARLKTTETLTSSMR